MGYPQNIDSFSNKLNKLDNNTYVIEEIVVLKDGIYEGELQHDNISLTSINLYTGSKLTGTKVKNFIISTPSSAPWKTNIKVFSDISPVYITYETTGDTVEADDINKVQDSIVQIETEIDRYKITNDLKVSNVEASKAEKTYVDTEFLTKADKSDTYTKEETDKRIQNIIGTAPSNLDTLQELAKALDNDANYASTVTTELSQKVDKVTGKQLSTEDYTTTEKTKLAGVQDNANNYVHPASHAATMITEDTAHRWTSDTEKSNWNDANSKKHTHSNLSLLETLTQSLINSWNSAVTHISDTVKHVTSDERTLWNTVSSKSNSNHTHDDRYYTEGESDSKFATKDDFGKTYTKEETDERIQNIIGTAPSNLGTLQELAKALNNDANYASTVTTELSQKVDKVTGKQLSTEDYTTTEKTKLAGVQDNANNYVHPASHAATMITEDTAHRWTSDTEKSNWNDANSKKHTHSNLSLLETLTQSLINSWNSAVTHISDTVKHVTSDERTLWNTVSSKSNSNHTHDDRYYTEAESDSKFATKDDLGKAGFGDMVKTVYDTNNDGKVDNANNSDTVGGKSASELVTRVATRLENIDLNTVYEGGFYAIKNTCSNIPINSDGYLLISSWNVSPWCAQIFIADDKIGTMFKRVVIGMNGSIPLWCGWKKVLTTAAGITWNDLKGV